MSPSNVGGIGLVAEEVHLGKQAPEPLTLAGIRARRAKAGKLDAPTASYSDSDMFKAPVSETYLTYPLHNGGEIRVSLDPLLCNACIFY